MSKIILYDLDKTLIDVASSTDLLLQNILRESGLDYNEDYKERFRAPESEGRPIRERLIDIFWENRWLFFYEKYSETKKCGKGFSPIFPWIREILELTKGDINIVLTNKDKHGTLVDIHWNDIWKYFDKIITSDDVDGNPTRLKPAPDLIEIWIKSYNPTSIIMIWDTANDINAINSIETSCSKLWVLAWWWNSNATLAHQKRLIRWEEWIDYILTRTIDDLYNFLKFTP